MRSSRAEEGKIIRVGRVCRLRRARQSKSSSASALLKLIERASQSALEGLQRLSGTLSRWFEPIFRYMRHRYTNGMTEGFNNKIKLIQRMAYGLRNEYNRLKRILAWCGET